MIFSTPSILRRRMLRVGMTSLLVVALALAADLLLGLCTNPSFSTSRALHKAIQRTRGAMGEIESAQPAAPAPRPEKSPGAAPEVPSTAGLRAAFNAKPLLRTAFVVSDDPRSVEDFKQHADKLDAIFPTAFHMNRADGTLQQAIDDATAGSLFAGRNLVLPIISNTDADGNWYPDPLAALLDNPEAGERLIGQLKDAVIRMHADGINIDFEQLSKNETDNLNEWIKRLAEVFHAEHLLVTIDIPLNDDVFDAEYLGEAADAVVLMAYDEHFAAGKPGSIAGQTWFTDGMEEMSKRIPPRKLIVALGAYGYDWNLSTSAHANATSFEEAMFLASDVDADIQAAADNLNSHFIYDDELKQKHEVWFLDAVSAWNQINIARSNQVRGFSLWRTGMEDPGIWDFLGENPDKFELAGLNAVKSAPSVHFLGDGELLRVRAVPADGQRNTSFDGRLVDWAEYRVMPHYYEVDRFGHSAAKRIALTFDDGPDPTWTPEVLKVLGKEQVAAAFFLVGDQAQRNPELVKSEFKQGHLLGNHTFLHPNIQNISEMHLRMEINATAREIESITGHEAKLFRAPFDTDTTPLQAAELKHLHAVDAMGLIVAGGDIDSDDYDKPGTDAIVNNVLRQLKPDGPNVVVMHDGGGDRLQTVEALAKLIPMLKSQGYEFVSLNQLMGVRAQDLMPLATTGDVVVDYGQSALTCLRSKGWSVLQFLFYGSTGLSVLRILFLGIFVRRKPSENRGAAAGFTPPVTVILPAYNESKVICRTLDGLLRADYPGLEILVVDDGSTDDTLALARAYEQIHPRVRVISKTNGGKWSALNLGFREIQHAYIITIDADTIIPPGTIRELIAPFQDPQVDAVCGNVQVGNVRNILTAFQDVEYVTTQNYDRRAFDSLNCISVVPGATGAWKRQAVLDAGGYSNQTLTEDADLTLTMLRRGARIVYAPDARSVTEAPETAAALFKQRFRWSFGTFQCLWKHRRCVGKGTLGWVAMPNLLLFQVVYPILSPVGDAVFILSLLRGDLGAIAVGYGMFLTMDLVGSVVAFRLDRRNMNTLWVVLIQRFYFRQFMYIVTFRSVIQAIRGGRQVWNKLERNASVTVPASYGTTHL